MISEFDIPISKINPEYYLNLVHFWSYLEQF